MSYTDIQLINAFIILVALYVLPRAFKLLKVKIFSLSIEELTVKLVEKRRKKLIELENELPSVLAINKQYPGLLKSVFLFICFIKITHILLMIGLGISILLNIN